MFIRGGTAKVPKFSFFVPFSLSVIDNPTIIVLSFCNIRPSKNFVISRRDGGTQSYTFGLHFLVILVGIQHPTVCFCVQPSESLFLHGSQKQG